ncbi:hypothetical protein GUITHDRAFT_117991 [Guillardia theta CCMP2712]|uniref:Uncharacterized protein n=1 Tax=Guillardia theta (strain CCMP2712) TaxID=905079 RepID=L1IHX3_GUITC|nr:hypothetical protein GUITHDRAFT_117991 [Guillardia theta CCMP2712]EKX35843.1 hypothetical protein GUITHDRAFT_117991 [Guillardia theta CCMP2712]|eukprot:XP_005822823.1 hypothetical protein GUITHDRAFT_117991 [Guillardia theta CCMP2712]
MEVIVREYKIKGMPKWDETKKDFLLAFCEAQVLKVAKLQAEIRHDTYNSRTVPALSRILELLQQAKAEAQAEKSNLEKQLAEYEAGGSMMERLAHEMGELKVQLKEKQWALEQVKKGVLDGF